MTPRGLTTQWIRVEDELPPTYEKVVLCYKENNRLKQSIASIGCLNHWSLHSPLIGITMGENQIVPTHWLRLPTLPKD